MPEETFACCCRWALRNQKREAAVECAFHASIRERAERAEAAANDLEAELQRLPAPPEELDTSPAARVSYALLLIEKMGERAEEDRAVRRRYAAALLIPSQACEPSDSGDFYVFNSERVEFDSAREAARKEIAQSFQCRHEIFEVPEKAECPYCRAPRKEGEMKDV